LAQLLANISTGQGSQLSNIALNQGNNASQAALAQGANQQQLIGNLTGAFGAYQGAQTPAVAQAAVPAQNFFGSAPVQGGNYNF